MLMGTIMVTHTIMGMTTRTAIITTTITRTITAMSMTTAISTIMAPPGTITTPTRTRTIPWGRRR